MNFPLSPYYWAGKTQKYPMHYATCRALGLISTPRTYSTIKGG